MRRWDVLKAPALPYDCLFNGNIVAREACLALHELGVILVYFWFFLKIPIQLFKQRDVIKDPEVTGFYPGLMVLLLVGGIVLAFLIGNYALYMYAQKTLPPKKKKPVSKKKLKREKLRQGVAPPGE